MSAPQVVLLIEPDVSFALDLTAELEGAGVSVHRVSHGDAVLEALAVSAPDLVVLDLILPRTDGRAVIQELREHPATATAPVFVLGRTAGQSLRDECFSLGADAYYDKPIPPEHLARLILARLERQLSIHAPSRRDVVTGVLNRAAAVEDAWSMMAGDGLEGILLFELDGLDHIRELLGWASGEYLLVEVARRLRDATPEQVRVARWEGDTFILLVPRRQGQVDPQVLSATCIEAVTGDPLAAPDQKIYPLSVSCGWARADADTYLATLMDTARRRVFRAQEQGGNRLDTGEGQPSDEPTRAYSILVAEDDPVAATLVEHHLLSEGFDVRRYADGASALGGAIEKRPDLILLDVKMPVMDGFEALERLRATPGIARVPIMMLTGLGNDSDLVRAFDLGADDYMVKPFSPPELAARIRRLLRR